MVSAGDLNDRVTVQVRSEVSDGHDGLEVAWPPLYRRIAAQVVDMDGRDLERARQVEPRATVEVTVRFWRNFRVDLDGGRARLVHHDVATERVLEIVAPPRDLEGAHAFVRVLCREAA